MRYYQWRRRAITVALVTVLMVLGSGLVVAAETPSEVVADLVNDGLFVAPARRSGVDLVELERQIEEARAAGIRVAVVIPSDPLPNSEAFARRVLEASGEGIYEAVIVIDPDGNHEVAVSDDYHDRILRSIEAARSGATPEDSVSLTVAALLAEPEPSVPAALDVIDGWVVRMVILLAVAVVVDLLLRQRRRRRYLAKLREISDPGVHGDARSHASVN